MRQPDGGLHVVEGQIRTLIAQKLELERVPVWVTDADPDVADNERRIATTLMQLNCNHRHVPMTRSDDAAAVALMLDLGASVTRVAQGLQSSRAAVKTAAKIGKSPTARQLLDSGPDSMERLEAIAHFESLGDTDAVEQLLHASQYGLARTRKRIEADRRETRERLQASLLYAALGFGVLTEEPSTGGVDPEFVPPQLLTTADGGSVTEQMIREDATRWLVWVEVTEHGQILDTSTGEVVNPASVDWDTQGDPEAVPGEGLRHADTVLVRDLWTPRYFLPAAQLNASGLRRCPPEPTGSDAEVAAQREAERVARRRVRELNKRGAVAKEHRVEIATTLLARRTPPAQAARFVAEALAQDPDLLSSHHARPTALTLLREEPRTEALVKTIQHDSPSRAWVVVLGMVLGALEARTGKDAWHYREPRVQRYLTFLAGVGEPLGYTLSDVEQAAAGLIDPADIDIPA
ncbi:hypothetical protein [Nocardia terpenica]|uniref:ParB/Sulfiredoxin domain-containing protein n=1 Tax=Nocardia terpenica TaxID=455432 RepID=A0A164IWM7_9NOCA|nr:hypothetical protein [Nocardia terpenica]KZM69812.1 hypothetical protein AWN90_04140 [Nocardia terpenica]NQE91160.1 hypothetical protein [Nocardia terpenica]